MGGGLQGLHSPLNISHDCLKLICKVSEQEVAMFFVFITFIGLLVVLDLLFYSLTVDKNLPPGHKINYIILLFRFSIKCQLMKALALGSEHINLPPPPSHSFFYRFPYFIKRQISSCPKIEFHIIKSQIWTCPKIQFYITKIQIWTCPKIQFYIIKS